MIDFSNIASQINTAVNQAQDGFNDMVDGIVNPPAPPAEPTPGDEIRHLIIDTMQSHLDGAVAWGQDAASNAAMLFDGIVETVSFGLIDSHLTEVTGIVNDAVGSQVDRFNALIDEGQASSREAPPAPVWAGLVDGARDIANGATDTGQSLLGGAAAAADEFFA